VEIGKIRELAAVSILPPREGFSPGAVGAVGMMVRLLAAPGDVVIGNDAGPEAFAAPRLLPVMPGLWPPFGRTERYMAGAVRRLRTLRGDAPLLVEVHNRANLALDVARAVPDAIVTLFLHNDPQAMRQAKRPQERAALLRRVNVVCVSGYLRDRFMDGVPDGAGRVHHLPNAIELAALPPPVPQAERERVFLFVGRAVADKGADAFVRAFGAVRAQLPGWRAVLIGADRFFPGSPDTPFLRALRPAAAAAGVEMLGYQTHATVLQAMARAAVVVVPSRWQEPFGLTALEAAASGAALICAPSGGLPEVAGNTALYAEPDPPGALEAAMLALARDGDRRAAMAAAGLARAARFDAPAARARLQALRRELLRGAGG
jgi:glycosyltransferase involved in cell wall biosynthesis